MSRYWVENAEICETFPEKKNWFKPDDRVKIFFSGLGIVPFYYLVLLKLGKHVERVILEAWSLEEEY